MITLLIKFWRELAIAILAIVSYFALSRKPEIKEVTKIEYVDRVVEKVVTIEKEVVKDKKKRTIVQKPDGTKVVTVTEENTKVKESKEETEIAKEKTIVQTEIKIDTKHSYNLGIDVKMYPETEYSSALYMRLGDLPILIGPKIYVRKTEYLQYGIGIGFQIEI